jgi:hypothetical protein
MVGQDQPQDTSAAATGDTASAGAKDNRDAEDNRAEHASGRTPPDATEEPADDDVRRKFRESLQRKRHQQNEQRSADGGKGTSKVKDGFGPSRSRREFRRKSGG